jgi:hypothetical protein
VVAASYLDTAAAFGATCGLGEEWLRRLLSFAPAPDFRGLAQERKSHQRWKRRTDRGYPEYGAIMLESRASKRFSREARQRRISAFGRARARNVFHLSNKGIGALKKALSGRKKAAARRTPSRPRSGRK